MKSILLILSVLFLGFAVLAQDPNLSMSGGAGWNGPEACPECVNLETPGTASLSNDKYNFYNKRRNPKKRKPIPQGGHSPDEATDK